MIGLAGTMTGAELTTKRMRRRNAIFGKRARREKKRNEPGSKPSRRMLPRRRKLSARKNPLATLAWTVANTAT